MHKRLFLFLLFSFSIVCGRTQTVQYDTSVVEEVVEEYDGEESYDEEEVLYDSILTIYPIVILPDTVSYWKSKKEFTYLKNLDSLLKVSQQKQQEKKAENVPIPNFSLLDRIFNGSLLKLILWSMAAIFVTVIIYQLLKNKGFFKGDYSKPVQEEAVLPEENILEQNFDSLVLNATRQEDYRLAIRYQFLKTLQLLRDRDLIEFAVDKTNSRYVHEVPEKLRSSFAGLILNYEYVWYGNFSLSPDQYNLLQKKYVSFNEKV